MTINTEIAVLYTGLNLVRVPWDEKERLKRDGVIAIAVLIAGQNKRFLCSIGHDYYQLVWTDKDCCLTGHDGDYGFYKFADPNRDTDWRFPFIMPKNCIEFEGAYADKDEWGKALLIYADQSGRMF